MKLYLANCSKQEFHFTYALPEKVRPFMHNIRAGGQIEIYCDNLAEAQIIVDQHGPYGMKNVKDITKGFGGLAYQFDKPINVQAIEQGIEQKDQEMIDRALEAQKVTAVASDDILARKAQEFGVKQKGALEIEVVEEKKNLADQEPKMNQTIAVVRDGLAPSTGRNAKRKGR